MLNLVIFGPPGSGKGTQSQLIARQYGLFHISTGEVLRENIANHTRLGELADKYISQGHLIPDDLMMEVLETEIRKDPARVERGIIFDGFPRTLPQAKELTRFMAESGETINAVLGLEVDDDVLITRMLKRGRETGRADDKIETIEERLKVYYTQTRPLIDYYVGEGNFHPIHGDGTVEDVFKNVKRIVDSLADL